MPQIFADLHPAFPTMFSIPSSLSIQWIKSWSKWWNFFWMFQEAVWEGFSQTASLVKVKPNLVKPEKTDIHLLVHFTLSSQNGFTIVSRFAQNKWSRSWDKFSQTVPKVNLEKLIVFFFQKVWIFWAPFYQKLIGFPKVWIFWLA